MEDNIFKKYEDFISRLVSKYEDEENDIYKRKIILEKTLCYQKRIKEAILDYENKAL